MPRCAEIYSPYNRGIWFLENSNEARKQGFYAYRMFLLADKLGDVRAYSKLKDLKAEYEIDGQKVPVYHGRDEVCYKVPEEYKTKTGE